MRVLKPEIAKERKEKILNWVIYKYVTTGRPISSELISENANFNISSATIRSVLKELEEEGYLNQVHTSGGRVPSDKGYRSYVDSILHLQNLAAAEKNMLETEYDRKMEQLDYFLRHTSKVLADLSKMTGFTLFSDIMNENLKRLDLVKISSKNYLFILVTDSGVIKHLPFSLDKNIEKNTLRALTSRLNKKLRDAKISGLKKELSSELSKGEAEKELGSALARLMDELHKEDNAIYLEGLSSIYSNMEDYTSEEIRDISRILEEKEKFSIMLRERLKDCSARTGQLPYEGNKRKHVVDVTIGSENSVKEFKNFSMISSSYCLRDKAVGLVGVIGYKRMEYPRVISIVDAVGGIMENMLAELDAFGEEEEF